MDLQYKCLPLEVKASAPDGSVFEGKASVFYNIDSTGEIVDDKAFDLDLAAFLQNGFIGGLNHDWDHPIGRPMEGTRPMPDHFHVKASVVDTMHGMDVRKLLKAGVIKKLSIGYKVLGDMMLGNEEECMTYWEQKGYKPNADDMARCKSGARVLTRIHLYEASPVTVPANDLAMITAVKAAREAAQAVLDAAPPTETFSEPVNDRLERITSTKTLSDIEGILREVGLSRTESKAVISKTHELKTPPTLLRDVESDEPDEPTEEPMTAPPPEAEPATEEAPAPEATVPDAPALEVPVEPQAEPEKSEPEKAGVTPVTVRYPYPAEAPVKIETPPSLDVLIQKRKTGTALSITWEELKARMDRRPWPPR